MKALASLLCLLASTAIAPAGIAVLSGGLTTINQETVGATFFAPVGSKSYARATEKHYIVLDTNSGAYQLLRLYKDGAVKKVAVALQGMVFGQTLPGDAKLRSTQYSYSEIGHTDNLYPATPGGLTSTVFRLTGVATAAAGESINLGGPFPATLTFARHVTHEFYYDFGMFVIADEHSQSEQTGKLTLNRPLSKAANDAGDDLLAARTAVIKELNRLGYQGP